MLSVELTEVRSRRILKASFFTMSVTSTFVTRCIKGSSIIKSPRADGSMGRDCAKCLILESKQTTQKYVIRDR